MSIETSQCEVCGTVVMAKFLRKHMDYVHGTGVERHEAPLGVDPKNGVQAKPKAPPASKPKHKAGTINAIAKVKTSKMTSSPKQLPAPKSKSKTSPPSIPKSQSKSSPKQAMLRLISRLEALRESIRPKPKLLAKGSRRASPKLTCALCGQTVSKGQMLEHKHEVHGERKVVPSPVQQHSPNRWVRVFQGGLPGLGKRNR